MSGCSYYLIHDSDTSSGFNVIINNDPTTNFNSKIKRTLEITSDGKKVFLGQKIAEDRFDVRVDGKPVPIPYDNVPKITQVTKDSWFFLRS